MSIKDYLRIDGLRAVYTATVFGAKTLMDPFSADLYRADVAAQSRTGKRTGKGMQNACGNVPLASK
jgi:hypothetical protein